LKIEDLKFQIARAAALRFDTPACLRAARIRDAGFVAKRMECAELAPAFSAPHRSIAGASSTHSIRFARFGGSIAAPLCMCLCGLQTNVGAADIDEAKLPPPADRKVSFDQDIKPIFEAKCFRCHGPEKPKSHFRLIDRESALKGGDNGTDIIPGAGARSPLVHYTARLVPDMEMPPEGKGEPLTPEQVGLLRAWIDQGAVWGATNPPVAFRFSVTPGARGIFVEGDKAKFREIEGVKEGAGGGVEEFTLEQQIGVDKKLSVEGRAIVPDNDYRVKLNLEKTDVGFVRGGFQEWRRYYDDTGGYYRPFSEPSFDLGRDLHLDIGRAWADFGLTLPRWPQIVVGYEYQFKQGAKSALEWGSVNGKNIYPASEDINERTHIAKLDLAYEIYGWRLEDRARVELYDLRTRHNDAASYTLGPQPDSTVHTKEGATHIQGMNTLRGERQIADWWLLTAGYLYSEFNGDASLNQTTTDSLGVPVPGNFWSSDQTRLERETHVVSVASLFLPAEGLSLSLAAQGDWQHQEGFGNVNLDTGDPNLPQFFQLIPAIVQSDLDTTRGEESAGLRYTGIPFTVMFGEARFEREDIRQFEHETGDVPELLQDTDATNDQRDGRLGFNTSPWRWFELSAHYRNTASATDYAHLNRIVAGGGYPAFIRHRKIEGDEVEAKLVLRPIGWLKATLTYRLAADDFWTDTDPVAGGISPGGYIFAGDSDAQVYSLGITLMPLRRFSFTGSFSYTDSRLRTAQNGDPSVVPYNGDIYSVIASARYTFNPATSLQATYSFSQAGFGQDNVADGLPLGLDYTRHGLMVGLTRRLTSYVASSLKYGFYRYSEPSTGGFNDYTAHGLFATVRVRWP
jgi:hypothetical protein